MIYIIRERLMKIRILGLACVVSILLGSLIGCSSDKKPASSNASTTSEATMDVSSLDETASTDSIADVGSDVTSTGSQQGSTTSSKTGTTPNNPGTTSTVSKTEKPPENYDITTAPLPERNLTNKNITYFYWSDLEKDPKAWHALMTKQYGVKFTVKKANFANYWSTLAMLIRSGQSPDVVEMPNWDFYPRAITMDVLQPLDDILDLNNGLWNETRDIMNKYKWKGKTYLTFLKEDMYSWFYYNETMMKNYGIKKTPKELFLEDNWTLEELKKIADEFVDAKSGTYGLTIQNFNLQAITGVNLVDYDEKAGYKLNMKDQKIATLMNWYHSMGAGGSGALKIEDPIGDFASQKTPMIITVANLFSDERIQKIRDSINWVPMPKMDKNSSYYLEMCEAPNLAIAKGAKNVQGAALALEFRRWLYLGRVQTTDFLAPKTNAAVQKYKLSIASNYDLLDAEERAWTKELLSKYNYKKADISWASWVNTTGSWSAYPGVSEIVREGKSWSSVMNTEYNKLNALLKAMCS